MVSLQQNPAYEAEVTSTLLSLKPIRTYASLASKNPRILGFGG
ncbi:hypothetical protein SynRCC2555_00282 [Synechococcus sp. WH 8101]|nr:hypothetical protein SynRCC2555_00282 [Synechococcus sp. WH 8101]